MRLGKIVLHMFRKQNSLALYRYERNSNDDRDMKRDGVVEQRMTSLVGATPVEGAFLAMCRISPLC